MHNADGEIAYIKNTNVHVMNKHSIIEHIDEILRYATQPTLVHTTYEANQGA